MSNPSSEHRSTLPPPRAFVDAEEMHWEVREIRSHELPERLAALLGDGDRRRAGWLVFESSTGEKRRLSPFPPDWSTISDFELERWCMRAMRVPPAPARRRED